MTTSRRTRQESNSGSARRRKGAAGFTLIEAVVYIAMFFVVAGCAFATFYRTEEQSRLLRRSADDMAAVLTAGERWRADVRAATAAPVVLGERGRQGLRIARRDGDVSYYLWENSIWSERAGQRPVELVSHVKACEFERVQRQVVASWRWDVELQTRQKDPHVRPLFTFAAVPPINP